MAVLEPTPFASYVHDAPLSNGPRALIRERRTPSRADVVTAARRLPDPANAALVVAGPHQGDLR